MNYWEGPARWINTILLVIVGFIGFDTLFTLLSANEDNVLVAFTQDVSAWFLSPFEGMFPEQDYLLTALIAILGYSMLAGVALAITRSVQASRRKQPSPPAGTSRRAEQAPRGNFQPPPPERPRDDRTQQL